MNTKEKKCWEEHNERMKPILEQCEKYELDNSEMMKFNHISQKILLNRLNELKCKKKI